MSGAARAADVAIIGGGIVGTATAAFLAEAGARVRLYERAAIAAAASGRNSGVIQHPFDPLLVGLYRESLALYRDLAGDDAFEIGRAPAGLLVVGTDVRLATELADAWRSAFPDVGAEAISGPALPDLEPGLAQDLAACRLDIGYPVAPGSAARAYAARAARNGAELRIGDVAAVARRGSTAVGVEVDGSIEPAGAVVVAAGPWTPEILDPGGAWRPIVPIWGVVAEIVLAEPPHHILEEMAIDIEPDEGRGDDPRGSVGFSLVTAAGATSLGSTFLDEEPDPGSFVTRLRERGARYVPALTDAALVGSRACARPVSLDRQPLVGRAPMLDRAFVAAGHGPWGISTGPQTARMVADLVLGRPSTVPRQLDPARRLP